MAPNIRPRPSPPAPPATRTCGGPVKVENCKLSYGNLSLPLISGEMQYWRIVREYWEPIILRAKEMGLRILSSYVPWVYHELAAGVYDFHGRTSPQRDLAGFIELLRRHDLYFIVRPGPYIYGSMPNGGVPDRAAAYDRLAPAFLAMARHYMQAVAEVIRPAQITCGGNIILCQADNEPYPPIESYGSESGCFAQDGLFKDWLREKYGHDLGRLNAQWNSRFQDFTEACVYFHEAYVDTAGPMAGRLLADPAVFPRYADTHEFVGWYGAKIVAEAKGWLRDAGIDIPVFANGWSPLYQDFHQFRTVADLAGIDVYPTPFFEGDGPVRDDWFYHLDILKLQQADVSHGNVWAAEYQGGIYPVESGYLPAQHFRYANRVFVAHGLRGWNWYIMTTRGNWAGNPIMEFGERNYSFAAVAAQNRLADRIEPWNCTPRHDLSLFCYKPHRVIDPGNFRDCFEQLQQANLSFDYYNPVANERPATPILLYAGGDWIDAETEARLAAFLTAGGTLIAFNRYPRWRPDMRTRTGLGFVDPVGARPVNVPVEIRLGKETCELRDVGHLGCKINLFFYREVPGQPLLARLSLKAKEVLLEQRAATAHEFVMGYVLMHGAGRIVHLGCNPSRRLLEAVLEELNQPAACVCDGAQVQTAIHAHEAGRLILYAINRGSVRQLCRVRLDFGRNGLEPGRRYRVTDPDTEETSVLAGAQFQALLVNIEPHDVAIRILEPAETTTP